MIAKPTALFLPLWNLFLAMLVWYLMLEALKKLGILSDGKSK
jgi:hypothetical protein